MGKAGLSLNALAGCRGLPVGCGVLCHMAVYFRFGFHSRTPDFEQPQRARLGPILWTEGIAARFLKQGANDSDAEGSLCTTTQVSGPYEPQ